MTFQVYRQGGYQHLSVTLKRLAAIATLFLAVVILFMALAPPSAQISGGINDKVLHFTAFATLVLPCAIFLARHLAWIVPLTFAFGGAIELVQPGFGREASWADFHADVLGVMFGVLLGLVLRSLVKRFLSAPKRQRQV